MISGFLPGSSGARDNFWMHAHPRRLSPRIEVQTLCSELVERGEQPGLVIDLGDGGFRLERPYLGGPTPREILLEVEVPDVDEVMWARAAVCFDRVRPGPFGMIRQTGLRILDAATRDLRLLRDYVFERRRAEQTVLEDLAMASCYARG